MTASVDGHAARTRRLGRWGEAPAAEHAQQAPHHGEHASRVGAACLHVGEEKWRPGAAKEHWFGRMIALPPVPGSYSKRCMCTFRTSPMPMKLATIADPP